MAKEIPIATVHACSGTPASVSRDTAEHYRWGVDCDAWYLVNDDQLSVIEELMPPGAAEIRHHHQKAQQFFYILSGEVLMEGNTADIVNDPEVRRLYLGEEFRL